MAPIRPMGMRLRAWSQVSGSTIGFDRLDVAADYESLRR
jgi:hypothetical protein